MFYSLRYPNFRLWFAAGLFASSAIWMQRIAQDWLVLKELSDNSGTQVGIITALQFLPILLLTPWAGLLADRSDRRRVVQITQVGSAVLALILGVLVLTGTIRLWHVYLLALSGGVVIALEAPSRQAFVSELVPRQDIPNAVALGSASFNVARLIGPALAGLVIQWVGTGWVFITNAFLFVGPVIALVCMDVDVLIQRVRATRTKGQISEALAYLAVRPDIILVMGVVTVVSCLGLNFQLTSAMMATEVFHKDAGEYGLLSSILAIGSLSGALCAARRKRPRLRGVVLSACALGVCELALALAPSYWLFAALTIPTGLCILTMLTNAMSVVQVTTPDHVQGRILAIYTMLFLGSIPVGSPVVGWVGETFGARWSLLVGAAGSLLAALVAGVWGLRNFNRDGRSPSRDTR